MIKEATYKKKSSNQENLKNQGSDNNQDWEIKKLGDVCDVIGGGTPSKKNLKFYEGDILWATVRDMKSEIISDTEFKITEEAVKKSSTNIIPKGNVIIATRVGLGKVCLLEKDTAINQDLRGIVPRKSKQLDNKFLFQWFKSISHLIVEEGTGATVQGVKLPFIKDLSLPLPPLPEQQRIVSILDKAFLAIERSRNNAEQNLKNAKELFESYLEKCLNPDSNDLLDNPDSKKQKKSSNQDNQKNQGSDKWEVKKLGEVCSNVFAGGDAPRNNFSEEANEKYQIPIYANAVKDRGLYGFTDVARVTQPSITIAARGSGTGHTELRTENYLPIVRLIVCIPNTEKISLEFLKFSIYTLKIMRSGSAIPQLTVPMIKEYEIPLPSLQTQQTIVRQLDALRAETQKLEAVYQKKIDDLDELKKSILQKAFAGELKLSESGLAGLKDEQDLNRIKKSSKSLNHINPNSDKNLANPKILKS